MMTPDPLAPEVELERVPNHGFSVRGFVPRERWDACLDISMHLAVSIPMPAISLEALLSMDLGDVIESGWQASQDLPLLMEDLFLANAELEPVGEKLGVRINGFVELPRIGLATGVPDLPDTNVEALAGKNYSLEDLKVTPTLCFGMTVMPMRDVLGLCVGDIVVLDRPVIAPATIIAGGRMVAQGDLVLSSGAYAVQVTRVAELSRHLPSYYSPF